MKKILQKKSIIKITFTVLVVLLFGINFSFAADYGLSNVKGKGLVEGSASQIVGNIIQYILGIVGVILVIVFIYGGVLYMTSGGNEEKVATAKKALTYGVIGIIIIALAFAITRYILSALFKS